MELLFHFYPKKIIELKEKIESTKPNRSEVELDEEQFIVMKNKIDSILNETDKERWIFKVNLLSKKDLTFAISLLFSELNKTDGILKIIDYRFEDSMMKQLLREYYNSNMLPLYTNFLIDKLSKTSRLDSISDRLIKYLKNGLIDSIVQFTITSSLSYSNLVQQAAELHIDKKSLAFKGIIKELIKLAYNNIISTIDDIISHVNEFTVEEQVVFLDNYLQDRNYNNLDNNIMKYYLNRYDRPNENFFWIKCRIETKEKFNKWLLKETIEEAFGNDERSTYWKKYIDNCQDFYIYKDESDGNIIMFYDDFVVVEFTRIGNAAYFYDINVFYEIFYKFQLRKYRVRPSLLKVQSQAITKKSHSGSWFFKFDDIMRKLLGGRRWGI